MLSIRLNGNNYEYFTDASVTRSIDTLTGTFSFTATQSPGIEFPIVVGDEVEILADGILVLTGYVETLRIAGDYRTHQIAIAGRGLTCDLIDSTVGDTKEFIKSISLTSLIRTVLDDIGMDFVRVIDRVCNIEPFKSTDITSAETGDGAFEFIEKYAKKRQVLLNETPSGHIEILQGESTVRGLHNLRNKVGSSRNNVLRYDLSMDFTNRFNKYTTRAQMDPQLQNVLIATNTIVDQSGESTDSDIRSTRVIEMSDNEGMDSEDAGGTAVWENNIRRARSIQYNATIQGHTFNGGIWQPNTITHVDDDFCNISSDLLVRSVGMNYSLNSGSTTTLTFADKNTYKLIANKPGSDKQKSAFARLFMGGSSE